ncbi:MAG TPA: deoxyribose-phosphate aldolase [Actinomycetota bacterium]|jgi:deoxyribose-phosphate aldolase|nr:deoxyribose-phosphate aldolase [Actinomycetota bacterium]
MTAEDIAAHIQHTNVRPEATGTDIERLLAECLEHGFNGAMVNPIWLPLAAAALKGSAVRVCTALDFPMGGATTASVAGQAAEAIRLGAQEIDVMTKVGWLRSGMEAEYRDHLAAVVSAADGAPVKAMLEAGLLAPDELARAVELAVEAGVSYVKNSSGFGGGDATPKLISELRRLAAGRVAVKASGGIRTREDAQALLAAGADLLGSSAGVRIVTGSPGSAPSDAY